MACMNVTDFVQQRQIGTCGRRKQKHVENFLEEKGLTSLINKECSLSGHCRSTFNMEFSPDGTKVASTHGDHTVRVTDIATGKCVRTLTGHPRTPWCLAYHPSSSHILASGCLDGQVRIWDLYGQGCEVWQTEQSAPIASMTFHPVDHLLVFATGKTIYFWDWGRPEPFAQCTTKLEYERVRWVKFDPLGHYLYTGISNNTTAQRDDASQVSVMNRRGGTQSQNQRSERLGVLYSNLLNRFQEYRRDQVESQVLRREPVQVTSSWEPIQDVEMYPGVSDSDIVRPISPERVQRLTEARHYAAEATHTSRLRARQHAEETRRSLQRARQYAAELTHAAELTQRATAARSNNRSRSGMGSSLYNIDLMTGTPSVPGAIIEDSTAESVLISDGNGANRIEDTEINITSDSNQRNLEMEIFTTESYDAELNNILRIENTVSDQRINDPEIVASVDYGASLNDHSVTDGASESNNTSAGLDQEITNNVRNVTVHSDTVDNTSGDKCASNSAEGPAVLSTRGIWSPPPRRLSAQELIGEAVGIREEQSNHQEEFVMERLESVREPKDQVEEEQNQTVTCKWNIGGQLKRQNVGQENNQKGQTNSQECFNCPSRQELNSVGQHGSEKEPSASTQNSAADSSAIPMLASCLRSQKTSRPNSTSTSTSDTKNTAVFRNIRERLQTNIPLTSCDSVSRTGAIRVLPRGKIPVVTVVSASNSATATSSLTESNRPIQTSRTSNSNTTTASFRPSLNSVTRDPNVRLGVDSGTSSANFRSELNSSADLRNALIHGNNYSPIVPTVIASTSSHASLFQNIYHNSRGTYNYNTRGGFGGGQMRNTTLSSSRTQPYLQNRSRYLSLMGPYLESRGVGINRFNENNADNPVLPGGTESTVSHTVGTGVTPSLNTPTGSERQTRIPDFGQPLTALNTTIAQSNPLESSDTESELSAHLHNRAYFLPISEDQTRTVSSTSVQSSSSLDSSENLVTQQRSISRGSVDTTVQGPMSSAETLVTNRNLTDDPESERIRHSNNQRLLIEVSSNNHDDNNNTISTSESLGQSAQTTQGPESYMTLRDNLVSMTDQIEQEMNELNRRINALRDNFNQSLEALRQDRERYHSLGQSLTLTSSNLAPAGSEGNLSNSPVNVPEIRVTNLEENQSSSRERLSLPTDLEGVSSQDSTLSQPPTLLETSLRSHNRRRQVSNSLDNPAEDNVENIEPQHWRMLQRHYLHPHYSSSILDETINRPNNAIQSAINRAIAGAFMGTGESAVANNIINQTHRIQYWDFTKLDIPDITNANQNIVVPHCKLHNDASCDISHDGTLLATFVPSHQGFPEDNILAIYSLVSSSRGQCLYTKSFGPNAVSISISPRNNFVMVGLAAKRLSWAFITNQIVAQIYKFEKKNAGEKSMKHITDVIHPCDMEIRTHISGNAAKWLPTPGHGLVYGTNRGHLRLCRPFCMAGVDKKLGSREDTVTLSSGRGPVSRRNLFRMLGLSNSSLPRTISISTQTNIRGVRQNSGTQTDNSDSD